MTKEFVKVFVCVPTTSMTRSIDGKHFDDPVQSVLKAIDELKERNVAKVGNYDNVSFTFSKGDSRYRAIPGSSATPTAGELGALHTEEEVVITFTAAKDSLGELIKVLKENHPYETPVIDVFDLVRHEFDALE